MILDGDGFLDKTPKTRSMKERIDKLDFIKLKYFYSVKDNVKNEKTNLKLGENICKITSEKGLLSKIYEELLKISNKETNNPI